MDCAPGAILAKIPLLKRMRLTRLQWDRNVVIHNLLNPFPWQTDSVDIVYSSHALEHFTREEGYRFLRECHRVLRPGGIIRIVVPDLKIQIADYMSGRVRADHFVESLLVLYPTQQHLLRRALLPFTFFPHKCMYDKETLLRVLREIGFVVYPKNGFESDIEDIRNIEAVDRTENSVIVEGRKQ